MNTQLVLAQTGAYIPMDRRHALAQNRTLPNRTHGAALFADISGFTPLTEALVKELGPRRGADELTYQLNRVYDALIGEVHRYHGSVITFSGDAITCWFDGDSGLQATACGLAMQAVMQADFSQLETPGGALVSLAMKAAVSVGPVRRFLIGDPAIQRMDALAGVTLEQMAQAESFAERGEVVLSPEAMQSLGDSVVSAATRIDDDTGRVFTVVTGLSEAVPPDPWPALDLAAIPPETLRTWILPPIYERLQTGQGRYLAELRPAVALFLRFGGLEYDHDENAGQKLDAYIRWVQNVLVGYNSYLFQLTIGDKGCYLYAAFGAPVAHDDDVSRAVSAALKLSQTPAEMAAIGAVQIGLSRGRMRAGAYGGTARATYGVLGDEVNLAARLMGQAEPGQVLVSQVIVDNLKQAYTVESLGLVKVKGKAEPQAVFWVKGRPLPSAQRPATLFHHPLVGREKELQQMGQALDRATQRRGQIFRLVGDAGLGKSHLAAEFAEKALEKGFTVAVGTCQSTSQEVAYYPWRQISRALFNLSEPPLTGEDDKIWSDREIQRIESRLRQTNPAWLLRMPLLADLLDLPIPDNPTTAAFDPQLRQEALFTLAIEIIENRAQVNPLLLLLEDVHWMDEASRNLTLALGRVLSNVPLVLALVHRPPLDGPLLPDLERLNYHHRFNLGELSLLGATSLVSHRLNGPVSPLAMSLIQAQAQGNPFFIEEMTDALREVEALQLNTKGTWELAPLIVDALREAQLLSVTDGGIQLRPNSSLSAVDLGIPDSIHGIVLSRLDRLPEAYKLTLKTASVIGRIFELDLLYLGHPLKLARETLIQDIEVLENRDFAYLETPPPRLTYMFKHNVTQEVTYDTLLEAQQRDLHHTIAQIIEMLDPEAVDKLAYHYSHSGNIPKIKVYLEKAARKAQAEYANETALNYYNRVLSLAENWQWRQGQVEVLHILGQREAEAEALQALADNPATPPFDLHYAWGRYYEAIGEYGQAQTAIETALNLARAASRHIEAARCLAQLGLITRRQGNYDQAHRHYNEALGLFSAQTRHQPAVTVVLTKILNELGTVYRQQGQFDQARQTYTEALQMSRASGNRQREAEALNHLGVTAFYERNFEKALEYYPQALEIRRSIGDRPGEGASLYSLAATATEAGDYSLGKTYFLDALTIQQAVGNRWEEVNIWNGLGILYFTLGDLFAAETSIRQGLKLAEEIGDEAGQAYLLCNLGLIARDQQKLPQARQHLQKTLALAQSQSDTYLEAYTYSYLASVSLHAEAFEQAIEEAQTALEMRLANNLRLFTTTDLANIAQAHLGAGRLAQAADYALQAKNLLDECGGEGPEFPHHDYFACYRVLNATAHLSAAEEALRVAHKLIINRAAKITDPVFQSSFLEKVALNQQIMRAFEGLG